LLQLCRVKCIMSKTHCYLTAFAQGLAMIISLTIFLMSGCTSDMSQAQWVSLIVLLGAVQLTQSLLAMSPMVMDWLLETKASLRLRDFRAMLGGFVLCITVLLGLYGCLGTMLWTRLDECPGLLSWKPSITVMVWLNIAFCLVCALNLLVGRVLAQAAHPNEQTPVERPVPARLLAHLTLRTFAVGAPTLLTARVASEKGQTQKSDTDRLQECVICLSGSYCPGDVVTELHCHHTFHSACIAGWILHGKGQSCPMRCNQVPTPTLKQLFDWVDVESAV